MLRNHYSFQIDKIVLLEQTLFVKFTLYDVYIPRTCRYIMFREYSLTKVKKQSARQQEQQENVSHPKVTSHVHLL